MIVINKIIRSANESCSMHERFLVERFLDKGICDSTTALAAILRTCDKDMQKRAMAAFERYCWNLTLPDPFDYAVLANRYKKCLKNYKLCSPENIAYNIGRIVFEQRAAVECSKSFAKL